MERTFQGDLADVVRASGGGGALAAAAAASCSTFPAEQIDDQGFGDPFSSIRDPLTVGFEEIGHGGADFMTVVNEERESIRVGGLGMPVGTCESREGLVSLSSPNAGRIQISSPRNPILKRRKSQSKKVVCIPAPTAANNRQGGGEVVPSDLWAWRKYGQKPIKGSPYPRGYYRCSSSKGCSARKQVERSRTDPNMLVITYTSEHNHPWPTQRNSLAGSSRIPTAATSSSSKPSPSQTTIKEETDPQQNQVNNNDIRPNLDRSTSLVKIGPKTIEDNDKNDGNEIVLASQVMMNELVFDYDKSYRPLIQADEPDQSGFFDDIRELQESDPLNDFLFDRGNKSTLEVDPFGSLFDWSTSANSNNTTTTNTNRHDNDF